MSQAPSQPTPAPGAPLLPAVRLERLARVSFVAAIVPPILVATMVGFKPLTNIPLAIADAMVMTSIVLFFGGTFGALALGTHVIRRYDDLPPATRVGSVLLARWARVIAVATLCALAFVVCSTAMIYDVRGGPP